MRRDFWTGFVYIWGWDISCECFVCIRLYLCLHLNSCEGSYVCMFAAQTSFPIAVACRCAAAASSLCAALTEISIARGLLMMACTCVSHYSKLPILPSKSRLFHSYFVAARMKTKLSAIRDSRKILSRVLLGCMTDLWNHHRPGETHVAVQRHGCSFLQMGLCCPVWEENRLQTKDIYSRILSSLFLDLNQQKSLLWLNPVT